ncbi:MAG: hypothetical protein RL037_1665, partial [Bacteroidota bacterium]
IKKEMKKAMEEGVLKTNRMTELGLDPSSSKDYDKFLEMESIKEFQNSEIHSFFNF